MLRQLCHSLVEAADPGIGAIVLTGAGDRAFTMGLDEALVMEHDRSVAHIRSMSTEDLQASRAAATTRQRAATAG